MEGMETITWHGPKGKLKRDAAYEQYKREGQRGLIKYSAVERTGKKVEGRSVWVSTWSIAYPKEDIVEKVRGN